MADNTPSDLREQGSSETRGVSGYATSPGRSRNMAANRRTDTKPEIAVRSALHRRGHRFRKDHRISLGGVTPRPDIVFTRAKVAVFIDGCFWHACAQHSRPPRQNTAYWGPKLQGNIDRDARHDRVLHDAGWMVLRIWEHEPVKTAVERIEICLTNRYTRQRPAR
jgi:DNA mismatch endonuclease (patch repair protein)